MATNADATSLLATRYLDIVHNCRTLCSEEYLLQWRWQFGGDGPQNQKAGREVGLQ